MFWFWLIFWFVIGNVVIDLILLAGINFDRDYFLVNGGFVIGVVFGVTLGGIFIMWNADKNVKECLSKNLFLKPSIIHVQDSSRKILNYTYEGKNKEIVFQKDSPEFYIPESLLLIEPCCCKVKIK